MLKFIALWYEILWYDNANYPAMPLQCFLKQFSLIHRILRIGGGDFEVNFNYENVNILKMSTLCLMWSEGSPPRIIHHLTYFFMIWPHSMLIYYSHPEYILKIDSTALRIIESKWELLIREVRGVNDWRYAV